MKAIEIILMGGLLTVAASGYAQKSKPCKSDKFDGYGYSTATGKTKPGQLFLIKDGEIHLKGKQVGYLMTRRTYGDFELTAQFRWADEQEDRTSSKRNSGIMFRVPETASDTLWPKGFQYQIKDNATGDFVLLQQVTVEVNDLVCGPGASVSVKRMVDAEKAAGEWNEIRIIAKGDAIEQYLNGVLVNKGRKGVGRQRAYFISVRRVSD
ncbi:MAG: DUF1080 domain-containing protein [Breznakibacter sp.]